MKKAKKNQIELLIMLGVALVVWIGSTVAANAAIRPKPPVPPAPPTASR